MHRFTNNPDDPQVLPPQVRADFERVAKILDQAVRPMTDLVRSMEKQGIFQRIQEIGKMVAENAQRHQALIDAVTLPSHPSEEPYFIHRIEKNPVIAELSDDDKHDIVQMVIAGLKNESSVRIDDPGRAIELFIEGDSVFRLPRDRHSYHLSEQRKKLLLTLNHKPQNRDVLRVQVGSATIDAFHQLVKGLNEQLSLKLNLREKVILEESGYLLNDLYNIRQIEQR